MTFFKYYLRNFSIATIFIVAIAIACYYTREEFTTPAVVTSSILLIFCILLPLLLLIKGYISYLKYKKNIKKLNINDI